MLNKNLVAKVRPLASPNLEKPSLKGAARIYVSRDSLLSLTGSLDNGRACTIERLDDSAENPPLKRNASIWVLPEKNLSPNVVVMTRAFQDATGFTIGEQVRITLDQDIPEANEVALLQIDDEKTETEGFVLYPLVWDAPIANSLNIAEQVFPGMVLKNVRINSVHSSFKVLSVNSSSTNIARFNAASTVIRLVESTEEAATSDAQTKVLAIDGVPGFKQQLLELNLFLGTFGRPLHLKNERESCALVIHGSHGAGKTHILQRIAETKWGKVHWIRSTDKGSVVKDTFKRAKVQQPSIVLIDDFQDLIGTDQSARNPIVEKIADELDELSAQTRANHELPRVVVIATCLDFMTDIPVKLQKMSRMAANIILPMPRATDRLEILQFLDPPFGEDEKEACLSELSQKTHAFNAGDLAKLVHHASLALSRRLSTATVPPASGQQHFITNEDMLQALSITEPTAMHGISVNPPTVRWGDVGGQENVKKVLARMIKRTTAMDPMIYKFIRDPPKGVLLYGPPGCSKTLCAQAMANESGFNFFSVKGAELLNMYVGETERALRALFKRARAAYPSIIFFDEFDSIGGQRSSMNRFSHASSTSSVNMVTTLLTEMDGFDVASGVLLIGATNRPEVIDKALLRAGRFGQHVYVGPPDLAAREAIFKVHLRNLPLASDVDICEIAKLADGYSGAEIQAICGLAGQSVVDRREEDDSIEPVMAEQDLLNAFAATPRQITKEMIEGFDEWSSKAHRID